MFQNERGKCEQVVNRGQHFILGQEFKVAYVFQVADDISLQKHK